MGHLGSLSYFRENRRRTARQSLSEKEINNGRHGSRQQMKQFLLFKRVVMKNERDTEEYLSIAQ